MAAMVTGTIAAALPAEAAKLNAPADQVVLLPRFCWAQYMPGVEGPEYSISGCGVFMNHYCPALLELNLARKPNTTRGEKLAHLEVAKRGTEYTLTNMKDDPVCAIRQHVQDTLRQVNTLLRLYGQR